MFFVIFFIFLFSNSDSDLVIERDFQRSVLTKKGENTQWVNHYIREFRFKNKIQGPGYYKHWISFGYNEKFGKITNIKVLRNGKEETNDLLKESSTENNIGNESFHYNLDLSKIKINDHIILKYTYECLENTDNLNLFSIQESFDIVKSELALEIDHRLKNQFKYELQNIESIPDSISVYSGDKIYTQYKWTFQNLEKYKEEYITPPLKDILKGIRYSYSPKTWTDAYELFDYNKRFEECLKDTVGLKSYASKFNFTGFSEEDVVQTIFHSVQKDFRYAYIDIHKDGFIPHRSIEMIEKKAADCKDYTMFMTHLFNELGYKTKHVYVMTNEYSQFRPDVKYMLQFNHVLLYVETPSGKEYYLDGTGRYLKTGEIRDDVQGTKALTRDPITNQFEVITVPLTSEKENVLSEEVEGTYSNAILSGTISLSYIGAYSQDVRYRLAKLDNEKLLEYYQDSYKSDNSQIKIASVEKIKTDLYNDTIKIKLTFSLATLEEELDFTNKLYGFKIDFLESAEYLTYREDERVNDYFFRFPPNRYNRSYRITFVNPVTLDYLPDPFSSKNEYIEKSIIYNFENNVLMGESQYTRKVSQIPKIAHEAIKNHYEQVYEMENEYITYKK